MPKQFRPIISAEIPHYMSAIGMQGARFIEGDPNAGKPVDGEPAGGSKPGEGGGDPKPGAEGSDEDKFDNPGGPKALAAEREARAAAEKELQAYKDREAEAEKLKLSDIERAQTEAAEAAKATESAQAELARYKVAAKHGITDEDDLELLATASDEATMERLAGRLAGRADADSRPPNTPKPDQSGGAAGEKTGTIAEQIAAAENAGDKNAVSALKAQQLGALASN